MVSALDRPIKVDTNTLKVERGKFARVCVEVDLTISVLGKIWVNDHWYKVQYEGFHLICSNCGCYGHLGRNCTVKTTANETENPPHNQQTAANHPQEPSQQNRNIPIPDQPQLISKSQNGYELIATLNCYPSLARFTVRDMRQTIAVGVIKDVMKKMKKDQDVTLKNGDAGAVDMIPTKPMVVGAFSRYHSLPRCAVRGMRHSVPVGVIKDAMKKEKKDQDVILKNGDAGAAEVIPTKAMVVGMLQTVDVGVIKDGMKEKKDQDAGGKITKHGRRRNTLK